MNKVFISGKISGRLNYYEDFGEVEAYLRAEGNLVLNPAMLPENLEHDDYLRITFAMIDVAKCVYMMDGWHDSVGARMELEYAIAKGYPVVFENAGWLEKVQWEEGKKVLPESRFSREGETVNDEES